MKFKLHGMVFCLLFALGLVFLFSIGACGSDGDDQGIKAEDVEPGNREQMKKFLGHIAVSVWFGIGAMPAQAQSVTLVANIEQATADYTAAPVGWFSRSNDINFVQAQSFTTGSNARGYRLTSMTIAVHKGDPDAALAVGIYTDSLGEPGEELYRLRGNVGSVGVTKFYAPRGAHLDADTDYFLVLINDDGENHYFVADGTGSDQEDAVLALGFSIGNSRLEKWVSDSDPSDGWGELPEALKMAANGFAAVTENTPETERDELTAHFQDMPEAHDGQSSFKFALLFNQEVDVYQRDMRDHVLQISEGTVENVRRLEPPSNRSWEYTVRPNSDTDMTIVLPVTSDCAVVGAVCTEDGKRLSNGLTATVSGPTARFENISENSAPSADAGDGGNFAVGSSVTLDGSGSTDSDGSITLYSWTQTEGDTVALTNAGLGRVSFTAPPTDSTQTLGFLLTVEDDDGASNTDTVSVFIYRENSPPNADAGDGGNFAVGSLITLDGSGSTDSDGSITSYSWTQTEGDTVTLTNAGLGRVSFMAPPTDSTQTLGFLLTVEDDDDSSNTDTVSIVVYRENNAPSADAGDGGDFAVGSLITLDGTKSTDSDGSITSYSWTQTEGDTVALTNAGLGRVSFMAPPTDSTQTLGFLLTVEDDDGAYDTNTVSIVIYPAPESVEIISPPVPPVVSSPPVPPVVSSPPSQASSGGCSIALENTENPQKSSILNLLLLLLTLFPKVLLKHPRRN